MTLYRVVGDEGEGVRAAGHLLGGALGPVTWPRLRPRHRHHVHRPGGAFGQDDDEDDDDDDDDDDVVT